MTRAYPLQTGANCVAYSFWVAMQEALCRVDKFRALGFTPADVERVTGAPTTVQDAGYRLFSFHPGFALRFLPTEEGGPTVWATWRNGYAHAFCQISATEMYDPALGQAVPLDLTKTSSPVSVGCLHPESFPYEKWYYHFGFIRSLLS